MTRLTDELIGAGMSVVAAHSRAAMFAGVEAVMGERGITPVHRFHVPGRIEVLGKHTDYAGGPSLLAAVERGFVVVSAPRPDAVVRLIDAGRGEETTVSLGPGEVLAGSPHWAVYPGAAARRFARDFAPPLQGADVAFVSDLPPSSGLSSSSALLIATFEALRAANDLDARPDFARTLPGVLDLAAYLGSVESGRAFRGFRGDVGVGTAGGSQDHTAILASEAGRICQFGYAPPRLEGSVALPAGMTFVVGMSGVAARKTGGARELYNRAAARSQTLLEIWGRATGRADATLFEAVTSAPDASSRLRDALGASSVGSFTSADLEARLDQFVDETLVLIPSAFEALGRGDLAAFGRAVDRSQRGAETRLGNQIPETIELCRLARSLGAHAASAMGAGFGGSVWALVSRDEVAGFRADWDREYRNRHDHKAASFFVTEAGPPLVRMIW